MSNDQPDRLRCSGCHEHKQADEFHRRNHQDNRGRGYRDYYCRSCSSERQRIQCRHRAQREGREYRPNQTTGPDRSCARCRQCFPIESFPLRLTRSRRKDGSIAEYRQINSYCDSCRPIAKAISASKQKVYQETTEQRERRYAKHAELRQKRRRRALVVELQRLTDLRSIMLGLAARARAHRMPLTVLAQAMDMHRTSIGRWSDPSWWDRALAMTVDGSRYRPRILPKSERKVMAFLLWLADEPDWWQRMGRS